MTKIRALIVDDERLARRRVRRLLAAEPDVEVLSECAGGRDAVEFLATHDVDLLFLDVQMPQVDGFGVLESVPAERSVPLVVFVTAYDEYALRAFQVHAFDYLLKPFDRARFSQVLERVRTQVGYVRNGRNRERLEMLLGQVGSKRKPSRIPVKDAHRVFFVPVENIDWVEAADNYVCLHVGRETHVLRETMSSFEARLDPERFVRIHRSAIVNVDRVKELRSWFHREHVVLLTTGKELTLSRRYRDRVMALLGA